MKALTASLAAGFLAFAPLAAQAGFTKTQSITGGGHKTLYDKTIYIVDDNISVTAGAGQSAYTVNENATVVLYIPAGKTLTLKGGAGSGTTGAGAGLEVPSSSTLIVVGGGKLVATGGTGGNGESGGNGGDAEVIDDDDDPHDEWGHAGKGGSGGSGGGGAGAGIGGKGGAGGAGRDEPEADWLDTDGSWTYRGYNGYIGNSGNVGNSGGKLYVLGTANVTATGGSKGANGGKAGSSGSFAREYWFYSYRAGGGGGGGGGGSGCAASAFGGGGGGGGAGGGGGEGGTYWTTQGYTERKATGGNGGGGSGGVSGSGTRTYGTSGWHDGNGGDGGIGGSSGSTGSGGTAYKSSTATVNGFSASESAESHSSIEYTITFDDGWRISKTATAKYGFALPAGPMASRYGYIFTGWYTGVNGTGTRYYDANGASTVSLWTHPGDLTLYPGWEVNDHESLDEVALTVNGVAVSEGTDVSGTGWSYSAASGRIDITGADSTYEIAGKDLHGFAPIFVSAANCTIKITDELQMAPGGREGYNPITVQSGASLTLEVADGGECSLEGADGRTSVSVATGATLTLKTEGWLTATGGDDAADIGLDKDASSCGDIYIETYANWFARFRPGRGLSENNGLLNNLGKSANFISASTGRTLWSVRMPELDESVMYLQRIDGDRHDAVQPGADGYAWFWLPTGGYEWGQRLNASLTAGDKLWICYVESQHSVASVFYPLKIEIDGEDIAHLNGKGWYATLTGSDGSVTNNTKATLVITDAGPHVVTGYGNAGIDIRADTSLTISNLTLTTSSWENKCAMLIEDGRTLNLTVVGDNRLTSGVNCPGIAVYPNRTINIDGDGSLRAQGGKNAAGIGGGYFDTRAGTINIKGGTITAIGGANAAGIGGGQTTRKSGTVTITGGKVTARGGQYGAAIGGGYKGYADVSITGGTVYPTPGSKASAIGAGYSAGSVTASEKIDVAAVYTTADKVSPSAKNSAGDAVFPVTFDLGVADCRITDLVINKISNTCNDIWTNEKGDLVLWLTSTSGNQRTITIVGVDEDGNEIKKSWGVSIDGSGDYKFSRDIVTVDGEPVVGGIDAAGLGWDYFADTSIMTFRSGSHTLGGSSTNGSIRIVVAGDDVALTVQKLTLKTPYDRLSPFVVSNKCTLTLVDESIFEGIYNPNGKTSAQKGSEYTAGLEVPAGASLTIEGDGTLTAIGGWCGAGIGSRGTGSENAGSITINGGYVYAIGGDGKSGGGAGIGGGLGGGVESITVNGGYVDATGGKGCCGIGGGWGKGIYLTNGTFRVTGGTVLAAKGADTVSSDFVTASGNTVDPTRGKSIVIDGACSVRPKNGVAANQNPCPWPVDSNGVRLVFSWIEGFGPGDMVHLSDDIWTQYDGTELLADDGEALCLWGVPTNVERNVEIESPNIQGGKMTFALSAATNTVFRLKDDYEAPESRKVNGVDCWRVSVGALPAKKRLPVEGIDAAYSRGTTVSDATGMTYLYLPDGTYDFTVGGYAYHAEVNGGVATATFTVGILVDGVDIGACSGDGWSYSGTTEVLSLNAAKEYVVSGTNAERQVSVCAATRGVKIRADRLELAPAGRGALYAADGVPSFEYAGGTLGTGEIPSQMVVSGGTIDATIQNPVAVTSSGVLTNAYCVTIDGLPRFAKIDIANIEGLENYDTQGIYANEYGEVYLYLPDGDYWFSVSDGTTTSEKIAIVDGAEAVALNYDPTGVSINGRDAARLRGDGWLNEDGLVRLLAATDYVLSGTNGGPAVTFQAQTSRTTLVFDNLVMTNAAMEVSPVSVGSGQKATFTVELRGTNILHGVSSDAWCGVEMLQMTELNFTGDGFLEATGQGPGIGMGRGEVADMSSVVIHSGTIVATGGSSAAGIGGGGGQDGIRTYVYGGSVTATGGNGAAGIGGGNNCYGAAVTITNGVVVATGGAGGAGIGGGQSGGAALRGACEITGGIVTAQGGDGAAGIGGGRNGASGFYVQQGGTVVAHSGSGGKDIGAGQGGTSAGRTTVSGGSLNAASAKVAPAAKNDSGENVYCVTVPVGRANFDIGAAMTDFAGYSLSGAVTDDEGKIYVWLPDGKYYINIANRPYRAIVDGADAEAEVWSVGVEVDGVDVALQSGEGWTYAVDTGVLSVFADGCVISGTNTAGDVSLVFTNSLSAVVSNLWIATSSVAAASPVSILSNAVVKLALAGTNGFASAGEGCAGLNVPYGSTLSITNLVDDATPYLAVRGADYAAGIGGGRIESHGSIEILGGAIVATGGAYGAGIGSGYFSESGSDEGDAATLRQGMVRILGGDVSATGGERAAGIGGGWTHSGGEIEIAGGKVTATSAMSGAGIGGGMAAHGYTISISGGEVSATGGSNGGAGIGGGIVIVGSSYSSANTALCRIAISGGRIAATGGAGSAGIGSGKAYNQHAAISITGGTVVATGGESIYGYSTTDDIGIGACDNPVPVVYPLTIKGASVHALNRTASAEYVSPAPSNGTTRVWCVTVETGKTNELVSVEYLDGYGEDSEIYADEEGKVYLWLPDGSHVFYVGGEPYAATVGGADTTAHEWLTGVTADGLDVSHVQTKGKKWYYDYGEKRLYVIGDCVVSGTNTAGQVNILASPIAEDEGGTGGSFAFTVSNLYLKSSSASPLAVSNGTVTVRLAGANTLDASSSRDYAALNVGATATLVVTNLEENAALTARGGTDGAGIGGNRGEGTGTIRIEGGIVYAYGIDDGAGIGSGYKGTCGDIYITGGRVTAIGGTCTEFFGSYCGAGIGGGDSSDSAGCRIEISGGTVVAESDIEVSTKYAALIGDGYSSKTKNGYSISITGGSIMSRRRTSRNTFFTESKASDTPNIPVDGAGAQVYRSSLSGYAANARVDLEIDGYGTNDIYADYAGAVHLWIAPGVYNASIGSVRYLLKVTESGGTLEELLPTGVFANGVDVYETSGAGWTYNPARGTLSITGDATLSGTNTAGAVRCRVETGANVVFSNLCLKATGNRQTPFAIASNATVSVTFTGTNTLAAGKYCAAIEVPYESGVSIGGDGWLYAAGGGGDGWSYPGIGASAEMYQAVSNVVIRSGNIVATTPEDFIDSISGALVAGGNVNMRDSNSAVNSDGALLDRVKVANLPAGKAVEITGLPAYYDVSNICADDSGNIYLWLSRGNYAFTVDGTKYFVGVAGSATTALVQDVDVTINGENVCMLSGGGWYYDVADRTLYVTNQGTYTVTGTNDEGKVAIYLRAEDGPVELVLKDLHLSGYTREDLYSPIVLSDIWNQQPVTLTLVSSNSLMSCADSTHFKYAGIYVPYARTLTIAGDGYLAVRGNSGAAIGGLDEYLSNTRRCGNIYITGGRIVARGSSSAIGSCDGQSCGDIVISGGTVEAETTSGQAIGTGGANLQQTVVITGGSVKATDAGAATVAVNASGAALSCVEVPGIVPGAAVAFDGLPEGYGTTCIYADADGKAYLWLLENWDTDAVSPHLLADSPHSSSGTSHAFAANGYRYTVTMSDAGAVATQGDPLPLESLKIDDFAVEDGWLVIRVTASPATWMYGFADTLEVRASETLPIPETDDAALDLSGAELRLEDGENATIAVPLGELPPSMFFKVKAK